MLLEVSSLNIEENDIIIIDDSSSDEVEFDESDDDEYGSEESKIRVGEEFQAELPDLRPDSERRLGKRLDKALLLWSPPGKQDRISDEEVDAFLEHAKKNYQYTIEQALGLLFWHDYDLAETFNDLPNFCPSSEAWSVEEKIVFEQALMEHGRTFHKIHEMLPSKSVPKLIEYYYKYWKKPKKKNSYDRAAKRLTAIRRSRNQENRTRKANTGIRKRKRYISRKKEQFRDDGDGLYTCVNCNDTGSRRQMAFLRDKVLCSKCIRVSEVLCS